MIKWLKNKIRDYLGINQLEEKYQKEVIRHQKQIDMLIDKMNTLQKKNNSVIELNDFLVSQFNLSADLADPRHHDNWAVLSIKGSPEYVKFIDLRNKDIRQIVDFLRQFEGTNRTIDSPFRMSEWLKW